MNHLILQPQRGLLYQLTTATWWWW